MQRSLKICFTISAIFFLFDVVAYHLSNILHRSLKLKVNDGALLMMSPSQGKVAEYFQTSVNLNPKWINSDY